MNDALRLAINMSRAVLALFLLTCSCLTLPRAQAQDAADSAQPLTITFLVNEGFLIQADGKSILIDAFVKDEYYGYGALPESTYRQMVKGEAPFDQVSLALTSHVHLDHFQVEPAVEFLKQHPGCAMMSGEEVVLAIRNSQSEPSVANQAIVLWPDPGKTKIGEHNGIVVEAFRLRHSGMRNADVQNLGLLVRWGEHSVLHVGDAEGSEENFKAYELPKRDIDVAILPVWHFADRNMIDAQIGAKTYIAGHIAVNDLASTKRELAGTQPDVIVLEKPLDQWKAK